MVRLSHRSNSTMRESNEVAADGTGAAGGAVCLTLGSDSTTSVASPTTAPLPLPLPLFLSSTEVGYLLWLCLPSRSATRP